MWGLCKFGSGVDVKNVNLGRHRRKWHHECRVDLDGWSFHLPHHRTVAVGAAAAWRDRALSELGGLPAAAADVDADAGALHDWWLRHVDCLLTG